MGVTWGYVGLHRLKYFGLGPSDLELKLLLPILGHNTKAVPQKWPGNTAAVRELGLHRVLLSLNH